MTDDCGQDSPVGINPAGERGTAEAHFRSILRDKSGVVTTSDPVLSRQLPMIQKIIRDETWLEGERRGCEVSPADRVVRENVCRIILTVGQQLREAAMRAVDTASAA